mmetsp:Transcript_7965/g.20451  ORF Transcript_7965/g.20451 Transcript_7965/m.20451 type:complete len:290 (-) Transcript_7965:1188-2057(-)
MPRGSASAGRLLADRGAHGTQSCSAPAGACPPAARAAVEAVGAEAEAAELPAIAERPASSALWRGLALMPTASAPASRPTHTSAYTAGERAALAIMSPTPAPSRNAPEKPLAKTSVCPGASAPWLSRAPPIAESCCAVERPLQPAEPHFSAVSAMPFAAVGAPKHFTYAAISVGYVAHQSSSWIGISRQSATELSWPRHCRPGAILYAAEGAGLLRSMMAPSKPSSVQATSASLELDVSAHTVLHSPPEYSSSVPAGAAVSLTSPSCGSLHEALTGAWTGRGAASAPTG